MAPDRLVERRTAAARAWSAFVAHAPDPGLLVRPEILTSWERAQRAITTDIPAAPLDDESETEGYWHDSPLQLAVERIQDELRRTADDGDLVVAVTDPGTRILWTYGGRVMRRKAETVNFVAGGRWDDGSAGTNALDLANRLDAPAMVFSAEHYAPIVHDWVCWAAPIHDPVSGARLGVVDLSTTWDRSHPIGLATARLLAGLIEQAVPRSGRYADGEESPDVGLSITLLGAADVRLDGRRLLLNRRQTEVLALLALHPEGLSLDRLHTLLYGDHAVTFSTLKAEVSHLRNAVGGRLGSRPYRLLLPVSTDVEHVLTALRTGRVAAAVEAYGGDLLPGTEAPGLIELGEYVTVAVREALLADPQPDSVLRYSELAPYDTEIVETCLTALATSGRANHPAMPLLRARLAAADL